MNCSVLINKSFYFIYFCCMNFYPNIFDKIEANRAYHFQEIEDGQMNYERSEIETSFLADLEAEEQSSSTTQIVNFYLGCFFMIGYGGI